MGKHTEGPWYAVKKERVDTGLGYTGDMIAITTDREDCHEGSVAGIWNPGSRCEANAHLIAAAPELLEALELAEWAAGAYGGECPACGYDGTDGHNLGCKLAAAIAKAKGETG